MEPTATIEFGSVKAEIIQTSARGEKFAYTVRCTAGGMDEPTVEEWNNLPSLTAAMLFAAERVVNWEAWI